MKDMMLEPSQLTQVDYPCKGCICDKCQNKNNCVKINCWVRCKQMGNFNKFFNCPSFIKIIIDMDGVNVR